VKIKIFKIAILPTLMKEHKFLMFDNRVLRRILGPKIEKVVEGWRTLPIWSFKNGILYQLLG
jgi:hypothetical protein